MKKNIIGITLLVIILIGMLTACSESKLASGAESLSDKKVYIITPSTGFATYDSTVKELEEVTDEESAPFLRVAHNGKESVDEKSGVTFVIEDDVTPSEEGIAIYDISDMSATELQTLYLDDFTEIVGEFDTAYSKCYIMSKK